MKPTAQQKAWELLEATIIHEGITAGSSFPCDCETLKGLIATMRENASKLWDAQGYIQNATSGLMMRGENNSPLLRDIVAADQQIEEVRQWLLSQNRDSKTP